MASLNLLGTMSRVETPYIKVVIGDYTFGVTERTTQSRYKSNSGTYKQQGVVYPNYIQNLSIKKINGQVNTYSLSIKFPIQSGTDPNFFEKVFSSVSRTRKIKFSYGDLSVPTFIYKDEEAIITNVKSKVNIKDSSIDYTVDAVSSAALATSGSYNFKSRMAKPSDVIKEILQQNEKYGLQDIFYGMRDYNKVITDGLIPGDDQVVLLPFKPNMSVFDYLNFLVQSMISVSQSGSSNKMSEYYTIQVIDDVSGEYGGPYFKITKNGKRDSLGVYEIDIGYPSENIVTDFSIEDDEAYSIYYDFQQKLHPEEYVRRVEEKTGELEEIYSPIISSGNDNFQTNTTDKIWWSKVTEFPIRATLTLKGLLRPAILMTHVRLNVYFFGRKHISSGLYIITSQQDFIGLGNNFKTTLKLTRIKGDDVDL